MTPETQRSSSADQHQTTIEKLGALMDEPIKEILRTHMEWMRDRETWALEGLSSAHTAQELFNPYLVRAAAEIAQEVILPNFWREGGSMDEARALNQAVLNSQEKIEAVFLEVFDSVFSGCVQPEIMACRRGELAFDFYKCATFGFGDNLPADAEVEESVTSFMNSIGGQARAATEDMV